MLKGSILNLKLPDAEPEPPIQKKGCLLDAILACKLEKMRKGAILFLRISITL
jgi:hypothetical protein